MGTDAISHVIGQQCAPVLAGIKPSNLLIVEKGNQNVLDHVLRGTHVQKKLLFTSQEKDFWLLYEKELLELVLKKSENKNFLMEIGYTEFELEALLTKLAKRFTCYKQKHADFPHEMGIYFGYPLADVVGFIENKGKNYKLSGYWKVYDDVAYANAMFRLYETVRSLYVELCRQGMKIADIYEHYKYTIAMN